MTFKEFVSTWVIRDYYVMGKQMVIIIKYVLKCLKSHNSVY